MASRHRLSGVPPAEFTQARDLLVKELRKNGEEDEAKRTAALRKPSVALWVTNQLSKEARQKVDALVDAAQKLKRAHASGDTEGLRDAMREQREALEALAQAAAGLAQKIGARPTQELLRRVQDTAQTAASSDPQALREGTLAGELLPAGFDALLGTKVAPARPRPPAAPEHDKDHERAMQERRAAEETAQRLAAEAKQAELVASAAQRTAEQARARAEEARKRADAAAADLRKL